MVADHPISSEKVIVKVLQEQLESKLSMKLTDDQLSKINHSGAFIKKVLLTFAANQKIYDQIFE